MKTTLLVLLLAGPLLAQEPVLIETVRISKIDPQAEHRPVYARIERAKIEQDKRARPSTAVRDFRPVRGTPLGLRREAIAAIIASGQDGGAALDEYYQRVQALLARREKYGRKLRQR